MKAILEIDGVQIADAVRKMVEAQGWQVDGKIEIVVHRGYEGDMREPGTPDTVSAKVKVSPRAPHIKSAYE